MTRPSDITIALVKATDWFDRLAPLFDAHKAECEPHLARAWAPSLEVYRGHEATNRYVGLVATSGDEVIGYAGGFIFPHPHYSPARWFSSDMLFIAKPHRSLALTLRMIREVETEAEARGCVMFTWGAKPNSPLAKVLGRTRRAEEIVFLKEM